MHDREPLQECIDHNDIVTKKDTGTFYRVRMLTVL